MKAVICTKYGPPEVLQLQEVEVPTPKNNEVLIRIHSTSCHVGDTRVRGFRVPLLHMIPFRLFLGIRRPRQPILGMELSGIVEKVGKDVNRFKPGNPVFASCGFTFGAYAEYRCLPADSFSEQKGWVMPKPDNVSFEEAAVAFNGSMTALELLQQAKIKKGQSILIYGASGSVGTFAVQLAKYFGATVTGVCSTPNVDLVKSLGAETALDYRKEDINQHESRYDIVFDAVGKLSSKSAKRLLNKNGIYRDVMKHSGSSGSIPMEDLTLISELLSTGKLRSVIDRSYTLDEIVDAHTYVDTGRKRGNVVVRVNTDISP